MDTKKSKDKKGKMPGSEFRCSPEEFKGMFEMMGKCCNAGDGFSDCSATMKTMMENCCGPKTENTSSEKSHK